jgi:hypothetical protein
MLFVIWYYLVHSYFIFVYSFSPLSFVLFSLASRSVLQRKFVKNQESSSNKKAHKGILEARLFQQRSVTLRKNRPSTRPARNQKTATPAATPKALTAFALQKASPAGRRAERRSVQEGWAPTAHLQPQPRATAPPRKREHHHLQP